MKEKKSLFAIIGTITVITLIIACFVIYNGITWGWDKLGEAFVSNGAVTIYVIIGIILIGLVNVLVILNRKKEIK